MIALVGVLAYLAVGFATVVFCARYAEMWFYDMGDFLVKLVLWPFCPPAGIVIALKRRKARDVV